MKKITLITLAMFIASNSIAQISIEKSVVVKPSFTDNNILIGENQLVYGPSFDKAKKKYAYKIYNKDLGLENTIFINEVPKKFKHEKSLLKGNMIFSIFYSKEDFLISVLDITKKENHVFGLKLKRSSFFFELHKNGNYLIAKVLSQTKANLNGSITMSLLTISINSENGDIKILKTGENSGEMLGIGNDEKSGEVIIYIKEYPKNKKPDKYIKGKTFAYISKANGDFIKKIELGDDRIRYSNISATKNGKDYMFIGNYSTHFPKVHTGIFMGISSNDYCEINTTHYKEIPSIWNNFDEKTRKNLSSNIYVQTSNVTRISTQNEFKVVKNIVSENGYTVIAEICSPTKGIPSYTTGGKSYFHKIAVIQHYNKSGKLMWDYAFKAFNPQRFFYTRMNLLNTVNINKNTFDILYCNNNILYCKTINYNGEILESKEAKFRGLQSKMLEKGTNAQKAIGVFVLPYGDKFIVAGKGDRKRSKQMDHKGYEYLIELADFK